MVEDIDVDVVVAGSGVGGLMAAYHAQRSGAKVLLLGGSGGASQRISSLNTALGYDEQDTPTGLFDDMFRAGGYVNTPAVVAAMVHRIGAETLHLVDLGVPFLRDQDRLARRQAAGSTWTRAVFSEGMIGADIARRLTAELAKCSAPAVVQVKGGLLLELLTDAGRVTGALAYSPRERRWVRAGAGAVVLATGGAGQLFGTTTNPRGSRGIGYVVALEAGAELMDMEFVSFEPFVTSAPEDLRGQDLPTTVLREGARLRNGEGEEFLDTSKAPTKDIICRAMVREVLEGRGTASGSILFDLREMEPENAHRYVGIEEALRSRGMTSREAQLEVMPAQHYLMGGVRIDAAGASTLPGLFAVGEVSGGAHGGHRLAAGGGLEVVAGGAIAGESAARHSLEHQRSKPSVRAADPRPELLPTSLSEMSKSDLATIQNALDGGCGILRHGEDLAKSIETIGQVLERSSDSADRFVHRSAIVALSIAKSALERTESRGDHFRIDHPQRDDTRWIANLVVALSEHGDLELRCERAGVATRHPVEASTPQLV